MNDELVKARKCNLRLERPFSLSITYNLQTIASTIFTPYSNYYSLFMTIDSKIQTQIAQLVSEIITDNDEERISSKFSQLVSLFLHPNPECLSKSNQEEEEKEEEEEEEEALIGKLYEEVILNLYVHWTNRVTLQEGIKKGKSGNEPSSSPFILLNSLYTFIKDMIVIHPSKTVLETSMTIIERGLEREGGSILKSVLLSLGTFYEQVFEWLLTNNVTKDKQSLLMNESEWIVSMFQRLDVIRVKCMIELLLSPSISDIIRNHVIRFIYSLVLLYSKPINLSRFPTPHIKSGLESPILSFSMIAEECLDHLLLSCRSETLSVGNITAILNLLIPLLKTQKWAIPRVLPFLLEFTENPPSKSVTSESQFRNILHILKVHFSNLLKLPTSRVYVSLIEPVLNDLNDKTKQGMNVPTRKSDKKSSRKINNESSPQSSSSSSTTLATEEIDRLVKRHTAILTNKQRTTFPFDLSRLSVKWIVEVIIGSLLSFSMQDLDESVKIYSGQLPILLEDLKSVPILVSNPLIDKNKLNHKEEEEEEKVIESQDVIMSHYDMDVQMSNVSPYSLPHSMDVLFQSLLTNTFINNNTYSDLFVTEKWTKMSLLARLITQLEQNSLLKDDLSDQMKTEEDHKIKDTSNVSGSSLFTKWTIAFLIGSFSNRSDWNVSVEEKLEWSLIWLYHEFICMKRRVSESVKGGESTHQHLHRLVRLVVNGFWNALVMNETISSQLLSKRAHQLNRFFSLIPILPNDIFTESLLLSHFDDTFLHDSSFMNESKLFFHVNILVELVTIRPKTEPLLLTHLLNLFVSPLSWIRKQSLEEGLPKLLIKSSPHLQTLIHEFAIHQVSHSLKSFSSFSLLLTTEEENEENNEKCLNCKEKLSIHLDLFLALCNKDPSLFLYLFPFYSSLSPLYQKKMCELVDPILKSIYLSKESQFLVSVIDQQSEGCEPFFLHVLLVLEKTIHQGWSSSALDSIQRTIDRLALDGRFLIPILCSLDKSRVLQVFPKLFTDLLSNSGTILEKERDFLVQEILPRLMSPLSKGALTPIEILVQLHVNESNLGIKKTIESIQVCFSLTIIFKQEVIASALQQLVERNPIPITLMRTVIQALQMYRSLTGFTHSLLLKLIGKKIWTQPLLWEGFLRVCQMMQPNSLSLLIQLPFPQLTSLLETHPEWKSILSAFMAQQPPSFRNRFASLFPLLTSSSTKSPFQSPSTHLS